MVEIFPRKAWSEIAGLPVLLEALGANAGETRFVGGFVRDTLLGISTADIDLATRLMPETVMDRVSAAGFKPIPTGLAHGTITALLPSGPVEVTTLRRDVSTDGRRASIAYTDDWTEDAARRDFTINALSVSTRDDRIHDYFGGVEDLKAGHVRFIGDPIARIAEDHLRILRFFRFHARFGRGAPDGEALAACARRANDLMALSRERIADELTKLLGLPDPEPTVALMVQRSILRPVLPEIGGDAPARLQRLIACERRAGVAPAALRRLSALLPSDPALAEAVAVRLKMSNAARKRLARAAETDGIEDARALAYRIGTESAVDRLLLAGNADAAAAIVEWTVPRLPVSGGHLVALGLKAGPAVAATLKAIEAQWIAEGFPDAARAEEIMRAFVPR